MTQPSFVPIVEADQVRPALRLETPRRWTGGRPGELAFPVRVGGGTGRGTPGPDQGYAMRLARHVEDRIRVQPGESVEDALVGCALLAARRSALLGRAPTMQDVEVACALWGYCEVDPPSALVDERRLAFSSVAHDYAAQRALVDRVTDATLLLSPEQVTASVRAGEWRSLVGEPAGGGPREHPDPPPGTPALDADPASPRAG